MKNFIINTQKMNVLLLIIGLSINLFSCSKDTDVPETNTIPETPTTVDYTVSVPCEGNSWIVGNWEATENLVTEGGIKNWKNSNDKIRTYFYAKTTGTIEVGIHAKFESATTLKVSLGNITQEVKFQSSNNYINHNVGSFTIDQVGYHFVELEGINNSGDSFGNIANILFGDSSWNSKISYVDADWFYWGRRGPSVHLNYEEPTNKDITWFYNEVTVPVGSDPIGSYFMANGFSDGYFGMQVNSATERHILFSVWSAFDTQDPDQIPDEYTVKPLGNGADVTVKEFGGEGAGAQSYFVYDWTPGNTYKFLLKGESYESNSIDYTAYFYAPEVGDWKLIASFRRPFPTSTHLTRLHSFLENFDTTMGDKTRQVDYSNQWVYDTQGVWSEITSALFTTDNTGKSGVRLDYDGGTQTEGDKFYLRNCGFFSDNQPSNTSHNRTASGTAPTIDFTKLEVPTIPEEPVYTILDRSNWSVLSFSSQEDTGGEGTTGRAADVLDDDLNTYWHSCWNGCDAAPPHHIIIDMGQSNTVDGFSFSQRQTLSRAVKDIEIQISSDNTNWESLGDFVLQNIKSKQYIGFSEEKSFRYFKFIVKSAHDGSKNATMAEISTYIKK
ncbi:MULTISPECIES: DUF3472 domain-containing protein [Flavobacteriaceae]|uniref:DUF5077 domain-containing protein n=2 Tax=Flavobacteriaceae TaxID=49546 RepID=A0A4Y8AUF0_9FLAO|nr:MULTISPECIES: DUF5077 domain-containing protein [Flavobacteriaceae]TEW75531.1 DUF5077 domain-containing protein [Gramella jeungdoensis]GGK45980.1 hypothetical protein GCM10007963_12800 [Lutibacter litoralis]